ncbi:hypothetical protein [Dactylosporangium sp. CA-092794]|uniref:hypothetical protein n=1 Tax=Dactylosporangium sp. CA-092794 TaxID=3239929 RepID=UPI003D8B7BA2
MSDQARQQPGPGQPAGGPSPNSPWAVPPMAREGEPSDWHQDQQTEPLVQPPQVQPPQIQPPYSPPPQPGPPAPYVDPQYGQVPPVYVPPPPQQYGGPPPYAPPGPPVSGPPGVWGQPAPPVSAPPGAWGQPQPWRADPSVPPLPGPGTGSGGGSGAGRSTGGGGGSGSGSRALLWTIVVAVVVALLAGAGGYLVGTGGKLAPAGGEAKAAPSTSPPLTAFQSIQANRNKAKFDGALLDLATPWLPDVAPCLTDTDAGGPKKFRGESKRVNCRYGGVLLQFVAYLSANDHDGAQANAMKSNAAAAELAPGAAPAGTKTGASGTTGQYIEIARKESGSDRIVCGIVWSPDGSDAALYMEAGCDDILGGDWNAFRDLWHRHS